MYLFSFLFKTNSQQFPKIISISKEKQLIGGNKRLEICLFHFKKKLIRYLYIFLELLF